MACDTRLKAKQTIAQRAEEVRRAVIGLSDALVSGRVKARVGPQGAIAFEGWDAAERDGITDSCAYRRLMITGSALAKVAIARAEQLAGRSVDRKVQVHGHVGADGIATWHPNHK